MQDQTLSPGAPRRALPAKNERGRTRLAARAVRSTASLSRRLGAGSGSTVGGRVGILVDRDLLAHLAKDRRMVLVTGTNGKTTTTRLTSAAAATLGPVATSDAGANMDAGLISALVATRDATIAVLEVDEAHLGQVLAATNAEVVVLLNLSRDQLDRTSEVRMLADRWRNALAGSQTHVVANADDPLVAWAAQKSPNVTWVGAGGTWHEDAYHCPECDERVSFAPAGSTAGWTCTCGLSRPETEFTLVGTQLNHRGDDPVEIDLAMPGRFNLANAAMAAVAANLLGVPIRRGLEAMREIHDVAGRFASHGVGGRSGSIMLAKNPAGWSELIDLVAPGTTPIVIGINARLADGHDPSWLWDVPFERLARHFVVATGDRRDDLAVRLLHAGVEHTTLEDAHRALAEAGTGRIDYIGNYTAFQDLRRSLSQVLPPSATPMPARIAPREIVRPTMTEPSVGAARESRLRIVVVHPDLLGTYGDGGNAIALANRAAWRGIPTELILAPSDQPLPRDGDIYCLGGGEDGPQSRAAERLGDGALAVAITRGAHVLAVCAGYQILGERFPGSNGDDIAGLGVLDVYTERAQPRAVGEILVRDERGRIATGFENHAGRTVRGAEVAALGEVGHGIGNGDGSDGARSARVLGTYLHGPVMARNAWLADDMLSAALGRGLEAIDDLEEQLLADIRIASARRSTSPLAAMRRRILRKSAGALVSNR